MSLFILEMILSNDIVESLHSDLTGNNYIVRRYYGAQGSQGWVCFHNSMPEQQPRPWVLTGLVCGVRKQTHA